MTEYEKLYDEIQEVMNKIDNFCGMEKMKGTADKKTIELCTTMMQQSCALSNTAHELEEHLAWDEDAKIADEDGEEDGEVLVCPICGHRFVQGEGDYDYDNACVHYTCPNCDWEGNNPNDMSIEGIKDRLECDKYDYDLDGVEITDEDARLVIDRIEEGDDYDTAIEDVLNGIKECLEAGIED